MAGRLMSDSQPGPELSMKAAFLMRSSEESDRAVAARKIPTQVLHFTHVDHLPSLIRHGLLADSVVQGNGFLTNEVGNRQIKDGRRTRRVPIATGGVVADYVPFYFAPRSPMMFSISKGNVPSYTGGTHRLIYLQSSLERLHELDHSVILTDRNARKAVAAFRQFNPSDPVDDGFIDWPLMSARYWSQTVEQPDRRERRMAEAL
ncbi:DUF4433 domain-containing protein, partial [uncultured Corynebacterium sp.]|uniref:type II toxin-antitoxin system toxin DNA ADP-ribosyl transferase DarT n=1 Tax=uncultured Corynebacterium sp. TaxID=159447 RepID=UPI0025D7C893